MPGWAAVGCGDAAPRAVEAPVLLVAARGALGQWLWGRCQRQPGMMLPLPQHRSSAKGRSQRAPARGLWPGMAKMCLRRVRAVGQLSILLCLGHISFPVSFL